MPRRPAAFAAPLLVAALLGSACSSGGDTPEIAGVEATEDARSVAYRAAVQRTIDAPTLTTQALVRVATSGGVAEFTITVRRTPDRREVDVETDQGRLQYVVTADGATVDRGDGPVAISREEVPSAPSLGALQDIRDLQFPEEGVATGMLDGAAIAADGADVGTVTVTVRHDPSGLVEALELRGPDDDYVALLTYRAA